MEGSQSLKKTIAGVGVTPVTPFTNDLIEVDQAGLKANLEFLVAAGVQLLYPAGNTGEAMSLSADEWTTVVETTLEIAGDTCRVLPGIGNEYPVAIELAHRARSLGVDGVLLMPRAQPYAASSGLSSYWIAILDAAQVPGVIYKRGLPDLTELLQLVDHGQVIACKYAEKDISTFASTVAAATTDVVWTCGIAERYAPFFYEAGAVGFTSGVANFAPEISLAMHQALVSGNSERALQLREASLPFEEIRARRGDAFNVAAVKTAMDLKGLAGGRVRPPLVDLDGSAKKDVNRFLESTTGAAE